MNLDPFRPCLAEISGHQLHFRSGCLRKALHDGCFALRIPADLDIAPGIRLANEFYLDAEDSTSDGSARYRGFRSRDGIYFDRDHYQTEHILIDGPRRRIELPELANAMIERMCSIGRIILRTILAAADVPPALWSRSTDQCSTDGGVQWFAVSHYRSERSAPGAPEHKDTGFVTVLYYDQPGLEALIGGQWLDVPPVPGHFLINFGGALELLTAHLTVPVRAVLHRVRRCEQRDNEVRDRFSFAAFLNPSANGEAFQISPARCELISRGSVESFLREFNRDTWHDEHADFGITNHPK